MKFYTPLPTGTSERAAQQHDKCQGSGTSGCMADAWAAPRHPTEEACAVTAKTITQFCKNFPELGRRLVGMLAWQLIPGRDCPIVSAAVANRTASDLLRIVVDLRRGYLCNEIEVYQTVARRAGDPDAYLAEEVGPNDNHRLLDHINVVVDGVTVAWACAIGLPGLHGAAWSVPLEAALDSARPGRHRGVSPAHSCEDEARRHRWTGPYTIGSALPGSSNFAYVLDCFLYASATHDELYPECREISAVAAALELARGAPLVDEGIPFDRIDPLRGKLLPFCRAVALFTETLPKAGKDQLSRLQEGEILQLLPTYPLPDGPVVWTSHIAQVVEHLEATA